LQLSKSSIYSTKPVLARHTVASALEAVKNADTSGCDPVPEMIARFKKAH
ncbi:TPA: transcriptional regulator, partial [Klebsiella pneumoniae]